MTTTVLAATDWEAAIAALLNRNLLVVSIQEKIGKKGRTSGGKVGLADLVVFTRQLATMIDAGLAMVQSFHDTIEEMGGTAILCRLTSSVIGALSQSGLDRLLHIRSTLNDAVWTF